MKVFRAPSHRALVGGVVFVVAGVFLYKARADLYHRYGAIAAVLPYLAGALGVMGLFLALDLHLRRYRPLLEADERGVSVDGAEPIAWGDIANVWIFTFTLRRRNFRCLVIDLAKRATIKRTQRGSLMMRAHDLLNRGALPGDIHVNERWIEMPLDKVLAGMTACRSGGVAGSGR